MFLSIPLAIHIRYIVRDNRNICRIERADKNEDSFHGNSIVAIYYIEEFLVIWNIANERRQ